MIWSVNALYQIMPLNNSDFPESKRLGLISKFETDALIYPADSISSMESLADIAEL